MALPLTYIRWFKESLPESVLCSWREYLHHRDDKHHTRPWITLWRENEAEVKQYILRAQIENRTCYKE